MILRSALVFAAAAFMLLLGATLATVGTADMGRVLDVAWGRVLLADFYLGVLCFAAVIWSIERSAAVTLAWTLGLALAGFPIAVLWLLQKGLPHLERPSRIE